jgi:hypothetical protein
MNLDVLCPKCGGVFNTIAPKFLMPQHGVPAVNCVGTGMPGTPINLIHVSATPPRVQIHA